MTSFNEIVRKILMSDFVKSVVRDLVQKILGIVFAYFAVHGFNVPASTVSNIDNWVILGVVAGLLWLWTIIVRAFEERQGTSAFDKWCRSIGRLLMFGIGSTPTYSDTSTSSTPAAPDPAPTAPVSTGTDMGA